MASAAGLWLTWGFSNRYVREVEQRVNRSLADTLAQALARHPGRVYTRGELLETVWGPEFDGYDHTVNTHINRLRGKVEADPAAPALIQTVWGSGYRLAESNDDPS